MSKDDNIIRTVCGGCSEELYENASGAPEKRIACPRCKSLNRSFSTTRTEHLTLSEWIRLKVTDENNKKQSQIQTGDDFHRDTRTWRKLIRVIDWGKNWYSEKIIDEKGATVFREIDEPLTDHTGRGSAKK